LLVDVSAFNSFNALTLLTEEDKGIWPEKPAPIIPKFSLVGSSPTWKKPE